MKRRGRNPNANPGVRLVERVELQDKHTKARLITVLVLVAVALAFIGYAIFSALNKEDGWIQIESAASPSGSVAADFVFLYDLGASGRSPNAEHKELTNRYTELCREAYRVLTADAAFDGARNLYDVNHNIGTAVTVDPTLYHALTLIQTAGDAGRFLFAAPYYDVYVNLFSATDDVIAATSDPLKNEAIATYFAALSAFTADEAHVRLELLGNYTVKLVVSDAYRTFAEANGIQTFADLGWTLNAFAVDFVADTLIREGYTYGSLSSEDGFIRVLDTRDTSYTYNLYGFVGETLYNAARLDYTGQQSTVFLRAYPMGDMDTRYYTYRTGERRHPYVDVNDGLCKSAMDGLVAYARPNGNTAARGCAEVLLSVLPIYLADTPDRTALTSLPASGVHAAFVDGTTVYCTQADARIVNLYNDGNLAFTVKHLPTP